MSKKAEIYKEIAKKFEELAAVEGSGAKTEAKSEASLEEMDFKALKALAKSLGVSTKGTREQLIAAIKEAQNSDGDDGETSKKSGNSKPAKKTVNKKEEPEDDEESDDSEGDDIRAKVEAAAEEMDDKELKEFCKDAGISTKGGRDAMLSKIEEAVRNGDLDESIFDDDEDDSEDEDDDDSDSEENEDDEDDDSEESEDDEDDEESDDDEDSDDEEDDGIADRDEVAKFAKSAKAQFKKGKLKIDAIKAFLKKAGVAVSKKQKPDELLDLYISTKAYFIDDEGDEHDFGDAYMLNEEPCCCGKPLEVKKQKGKHVGVCSVCGGKYPLDEE